MPNEVNELDRLMSLDPLELSSQDIDAIILYQRKARLMSESGVKPKKGQSSEKIDLATLFAGQVTKAAVKRRKV